MVDAQQGDIDDGDVEPLEDDTGGPAGMYVSSAASAILT